MIMVTGMLKIKKEILVFDSLNIYLYVLFGVLAFNCDADNDYKEYDNDDDGGDERNMTQTDNIKREVSKDDDDANEKGWQG